MMKKYIERKLLLNSNGEGMLEKPLELEYYLVESIPENTGVQESGKIYGIGIAKRVDSNCYEEKVIRDFSSCIHETRATLEILASHSVTPDTLLHVLDDMLGSV